MTSLSDQGAFHPDLRAAARWLPRGGIGPRSLGAARLLSHLAARRPVDDVHVESLGSFSIRMHSTREAKAKRPALLWLHGGGFVFGTAAQDDGLCRHLAAKLGIVVASVDYRLAPEHPFPTPLHDCYEALTWLAGREGVDPDRLAIGGASAGAGLAAALALLAKERGQVKPVLQLLSYPMLDDRTAERTDIDEHHFRLWRNRSNRFGWSSYTGKDPGSANVSPLAAPARYDDLSGLPDAWIGVGTLDLFYDEDVAYARRLEDAGVQCELDIVEGAFHGFDAVSRRAQVCKEYRARQIEALAAALA
jgi:acetyl esterase/lipase